MYQALSIILSIILPLTNLTHGYVSACIGALIGVFGKSNTIRWVASFTLLGVFCVYILWSYSNIFRGMGELTFHRDIFVFAPLFALIGLLGSGVFRYQTNNADWRWLIVFPLIGIGAAVLYQSRGVILWMVILGSICGGVLWYITNPRLHWVFLFAGVGFIFTSIMLVVGYSRGYNFLVISLGTITGGLVGWFAQNRNINWIIALSMIGILAGGGVETIYLSWGLLPIVIGGLSGSVIGLILQAHRYREIFAFVIFGGIFFCSIKLSWDTMRFLEWAWQTL